MVRWIVRQWDWFIYRAARASMRRLAVGFGGFVYLHLLEVADILEEYPLPGSLKKSAETLHGSLTGRKPDTPLGVDEVPCEECGHPMSWASGCPDCGIEPADEGL